LPVEGADVGLNFCPGPSDEELEEKYSRPDDAPKHVKKPKAKPRKTVTFAKEVKGGEEEIPKLKVGDWVYWLAALKRGSVFSQRLRKTISLSSIPTILQGVARKTLSCRFGPTTTTEPSSAASARKDGNPQSGESPHRS
jgi:hypothetical protein